MKTCSNCKIEVGGNLKICPLCKEKLHGKEERKYWPAPKELKKASKLYKYQLLIMIAACVVVFIIDNVINLFPQITWWPVFVIEAFFIEIVIRMIIRRKKAVPMIVTEGLIGTSVLIGITSIWLPVLIFIVPILLTVMVVIDFIYSIADKKGYYVIFFIISLFVGAGSFIVILILGMHRGFTWYMCLFTCIVAFLVNLIVKGKDIFSEIKRRVSL